MSNNMPAAEIDIDEALVTRLLAAQHPDLATLPVAPLASGWDNAVFRLGDELTVRLPRRQIGADVIATEQRWLPELALRLPLPTPRPLRVGMPTAEYPWRWSICPWLPGNTAATSPPANLTDAARALGAFVAALHTPAPTDAPFNPYRSVPLCARAQRLQQRVAQLTTAIDVDAVQQLWQALSSRPVWSHSPTWMHGDLHAMNVLVHEGRISAVIDFGDLAAGEPAPDLAVAWMLFAPAERAVFRAASGAIDTDTWARGRGWALVFALEYLANSADNLTMHQLGRRTLAAVLSDHD